MNTALLCATVFLLSVNPTKRATLFDELALLTYDTEIAKTSADQDARLLQSHLDVKMKELMQSLGLTREQMRLEIAPRIQEMQSKKQTEVQAKSERRAQEQVILDKTKMPEFVHKDSLEVKDAVEGLAFVSNDAATVILRGSSDHNFKFDLIVMDVATRERKNWLINNLAVIPSPDQKILYVINSNFEISQYVAETRSLIGKNKLPLSEEQIGYIKSGLIRLSISEDGSKMSLISREQVYVFDLHNFAILANMSGVRGANALFGADDVLAYADGIVIKYNFTTKIPQATDLKTSGVIGKDVMLFDKENDQYVYITPERVHLLDRNLKEFERTPTNGTFFHIHAIPNAQDYLMAVDTKAGGIGVYHREGAKVENKYFLEANIATASKSVIDGIFSADGLTYVLLGRDFQGPNSMSIWRRK